MKNIENTKIDYLNIGKFVGRTRSGQGLWECRCECGNEFVVDELYLNQKRFHGIFMFNQFMEYLYMSSHLLLKK